jgi:AcrR family transcriptional regulator
MDAIAASSGVSKATIYKHWPDKDHLALEVLTWLHGLDQERPNFDSGDLREDLIATLNYHPSEDRTELKERLMPHLIAYSARNQVFGNAWRARAVKTQRASLTQVLQAAIARGELDRSLNIDTAIAMLIGPFIYRRVFVTRNRNDKPPIAFIAQIVDAFCKSFSRS